MGMQTKHSGGSRYYFDEDAPETKYPGVTSVIDLLAKPFLQHWSAKMAAELAVDSLDILGPMAERDRAGAVNYVKGAASRYSKRRSSVGSEAHVLFEKMIRNQHIGRVHPDMVPYHRNFAAFLDALQPELVRAEDVVWSAEHEYAGSFDGIVKLKLDENGKPDPQGEAATVMVDWKTGKDTYPEVALQLAAYRFAEEVIDAEGVRSPMPETDGAMVLHITDQQATFKPVETSEWVFNYFLALRTLFDWQTTDSRKVLGDPIWTTAAQQTGTERRAK